MTNGVWVVLSIPVSLAGHLDLDLADNPVNSLARLCLNLNSVTKAMWVKHIYADSAFCCDLQPVPLSCWNPLFIIDLYDNNAQRAIQEPAAIPMNLKMTLH